LSADARCAVRIAVRDSAQLDERNFERQYDASGKTLFGTPLSKAAYQNPRSYTMALGLRF
jgi:hypothetical protein